MAEKTKDNRYRNFATVVYPESAPLDWVGIIESHCVPAFISPLHDSDKNPTGESKKHHHHVMLMFEGKKSIEQVQELTELFGGVGIIRVQSLRGMARYLCHLDNPEKAQYSPDEVKSLSGADYFGAIQAQTDKYKAVDEMTAFCDANEVYSFRELLNYSKENRRDWFRALCDSCSLVMIRFLKAKTWEKECRYKQSTSSDNSKV